MTVTKKASPKKQTQQSPEEISASINALKVQVYDLSQQAGYHENAKQAIMQEIGKINQQIEQLLQEQKKPVEKA